MEILDYGVPLDLNSLVAQVAKVRASIKAGKGASLDYPGTYFPNQLMLVLSVLAEQLDEEARYLLATKLLEKGLLPSHNASRLAGRTIEVSRPGDASQDDERVEAMRAAASDELFLADLAAAMEDFQYADYDEQPA
jgi:hypothetical protein